MGPPSFSFTLIAMWVTRNTGKGLSSIGTAHLSPTTILDIQNLPKKRGGRLFPGSLSRSLELYDLGHLGKKEAL